MAETAVNPITKGPGPPGAQSHAISPVITPEELARAREFTGFVERVRDLTHDIKELRIGLIHPKAIELVAGQYILLEAPGYGDNPEPISRAYSISSPPEDDGWTGERGLITHIVDRHVANGSDQEGYLCGSPGLIDASAKILMAKGVTEDRIFYDKFT